MTDWMEKAVRKAAPAARVRGRAVLSPEEFGAAAPLPPERATAAAQGAVKNPKSTRCPLAQAAPGPLKPRKNPGQKLNDDGARRFICAVVEQAVEDFKILVRRGRIVNGQAMPSERQTIAAGYEYQDHVKRLLHFFQPGGPMDMWLGAAGIQINPNLIRERLGIAP